jgi:hypothetical protein
VRRNRPGGVLYFGGAQVSRPKEPRLPLKLKLLPGLKWTGQLEVIARDPGGYVVGFDAKVRGQERYIFDRTVMTSGQLKGWTGIDLAIAEAALERQGAEQGEKR